MQVVIPGRVKRLGEVMRSRYTVSNLQRKGLRGSPECTFLLMHCTVHCCVTSTIPATSFSLLLRLKYVVFKFTYHCVLNPQSESVQSLVLEDLCFLFLFLFFLSFFFRSFFFFFFLLRW